MSQPGRNYLDEDGSVSKGGTAATGSNGSGQGCTAADLEITPEEAAAASKIVEKLIKRSLQDAMVDVLQPAIQKAFLGNLCTLAKNAAAPGGGQDGGGGTSDPKDESGGGG